MKISLYWHNGRSLGHTAEVSKICHGIKRDIPNSTMVGLTGAYKGLDLLPTEVDIVKLPAFVNYDNPSGWNMTGRQGLDAQSLFKLRTEMAEVFIRHYQPDIFLINHLPYGAEQELKPALTGTRSGLRILTLRGVLFDREKTNREYFSGEPYKWIEEQFDAILVHIDPNVFNLEEHYNIPQALKNRIHYTGYLANKIEKTKLEARNELNIDKNERLVVASMGGGQGALQIWNSMIDALSKQKHMFDRAVIVTGPYLEADSEIELKKIALYHPWLEIKKYVPNMTTWMKASDLFIGAAGSNMLGEILSTGCNSITIPRQVREVEQLIHSSILADKGIVRVCSMEQLFDNRLGKIIDEALREPIINYNNVRLNGANRYADYLEKLR